MNWSKVADANHSTKIAAMFALPVLVVLLVIAGVMSSRPKPSVDAKESASIRESLNAEPAPVPVASAGWAEAARIFESSGIRVEPFDPSVPNAMRVTIPSAIAMDMTATQARELAGVAQRRIGPDTAIVTIKSEGGQQLAKATPWGVD